MRQTAFSIVFTLFGCIPWAVAQVGYSDTPVLPDQKWRVHDINRPAPRLVTPGATPGAPPSDAIVLFDGADLSKWETPNRTTGKMGPATWIVENGSIYAEDRTGELVTKERFGDIQLHVEFQTPAKIEGSSQDRGNSGVLLMSRYEIQVLDSWENPTYADGQAGSIYGQWPPLVNASKKPGEWQTYDIIFEAPKFADEKLVKPAYVTVLHNGILTQHRQEIIGAMAHRQVGKYSPHSPEEPLALQNHNTRTHYRNIWVRRLSGYDQPR